LLIFTNNCSVAAHVLWYASQAAYGGVYLDPGASDNTYNAYSDINAAGGFSLYACPSADYARKSDGSAASMGLNNPFACTRNWVDNPLAVPSIDACRVGDISWQSHETLPSVPQQAAGMIAGCNQIRLEGYAARIIPAEDAETNRGCSRHRFALVTYAPRRINFYCLLAVAMS
jgi:hypothetical protein